MDERQTIEVIRNGPLYLVVKYGTRFGFSGKDEKGKLRAVTEIRFYMYLN